jgi:hypothetical protein
VREALPQELSANMAAIRTALSLVLQKAERDGIKILAIVHEPSNWMTFRASNCSNAEGRELAQLLVKMSDEEYKEQLK